MRHTRGEWIRRQDDVASSEIEEWIQKLMEGGREEKHDDGA